MRSRVWASLALLGLASCGGAPPRPPSSWPEAASGCLVEGAEACSEPAATKPTGPLAPFDLKGELAKARRVSDRAPSQHRGGDAEGEIFANEAAAGYRTLARGRRLAVGATAIERHFDGSTFVMAKRAAGFDPPGGDWEFVVLAKNGAVEERGALPLCARCHAEAVHDHLFGPSAR